MMKKQAPSVALKGSTTPEQQQQPAAAQCAPGWVTSTFRRLRSVFQRSAAPSKSDDCIQIKNPSTGGPIVIESK